MQKDILPVSTPVFGSETEYSILLGKNENYDSVKQLWSEAGEIALLGINMQYDQKHKEYLENGGRFYHDVGDHQEYATPEILSTEDVVVFEIAGEDIVLSSFKYLQDYGEIRDFKLFKRSSDYEGNSWGYHENFIVPNNFRHDDYKKRYIGLFAGHNATRAIYAGAGGIVNLTPHKKHENRFSYAVSPRLTKTSIEYNDSRQQSKPLVNTSFDDDVEFVRAQQVSSEAAIFPWSIRVRHGMNSIIAKLVQSRVEVDELHFSKATRAARKIGLDTEMKYRFQTREGRSVSALDWQEKLMDIVIDETDRSLDLNLDEQWVVSAVTGVIDDLKSGSDDIDYKVEWKAKLKYLRRLFGDNPDWSDPEVIQRDAYWTNLEGGMGVQLRSNGVGWSGFEHLQQDALSGLYTHFPPVNTRANIRSQFIREGSGDLDTHKWHQIEYDGQLHFISPYETKFSKTA